jgi:hypothetical protein
MSGQNLQQAAGAVNNTQRPAATTAPVTEAPVAQHPMDDGMDLGEQTPVTSYNNENSGALFPNKRRTKETHPNSQGKALVNGVWFWISGWTKMPVGGGDKFISLAFTELTAEEVEKYCAA